MSQWIIELLFGTGEYMYAVAWYVPLLASAAASGVSHLAGRGARKADQRRLSEFQGKADEAGSDFMKSLQSLQERGEAVSGDKTVDELYGPQIQQFTDRVAADQGKNESNVFRQLLAGGGDITGQGQSMLQNLSETGNRGISDIVAKFTEMTDRRNLQEKSRADNILTNVLGQRGNLFNAMQGLFGEQQGRVDRRKTANKQFGLDALGIGAQLSGQLYNHNSHERRSENRS